MIAYAKTPIGFWMKAEFDGFVLVRLQWQNVDFKGAIENPDLNHYLNCWFEQLPYTTFHSAKLEGTHFQKKVWSALECIPWGETRTYGEIAEQIGSPRAQQAVGQACKKNPLPLLIPCHRVIGQNQSMIGYFGLEHVDIKMLLLDWERTR